MAINTTTVYRTCLYSLSNSIILLLPPCVIPDKLLLTQAPTIFVWFYGTITIVYYYYYPLNYVLQYLRFVMFGGSAWRLI